MRIEHDEGIDLSEDGNASTLKQKTEVCFLSLFCRLAVREGRWRDVPEGERRTELPISTVTFFYVFIARAEENLTEYIDVRV